MSGKPEPVLPCRIPDHTLVRVIGRGAYGEVWLAKNIMGTWRAVKIVRRQSFTSERPYKREFEGIRKFEPVSRAHDTQVAILHVGRDDEAGLFYYVMELGDDVHSGQEIAPETYTPRTLASELKEKQRLPVRPCLEIGLTLATALDHLHAHGLIHRDIKPSNIIFVHGQPKLADIGLVAEAADAMSFVGTEGYVPIEGPGSSRADIFSLGRVLYEISTGFSQRQFPDIRTSFGLDEEDAEMARELNLVINKACAHGADHRHESAAALRDELILLQSGHSIRRLRDNERRLRVVRWVGALAMVVAAFSLVGYISARRANVRADANAKTSRAHLAAARLAQAKSLHGTDIAGRRAEALAAISEAARIAPSRELRNEALALLPLPDLGPPELMAPYPTGFTPNMRRPLRARLSPDGSQCAWAMDRNFVLITKTADGSEIARLPFKGLYGRALEWSPGGRYLAAYSEKKVVVWDWRERKETITHDIERSDAGIAAAFSANDERVVLCLGNRVGVFESASGKEIVMVERDQRQTAFAIHPDGDLFGFTGPGSAGLWSAASKSEVMGRELPKGAGGSFSFRHVAWSGDGKLIAGILTDGTLLMYNHDSGKVILRVGHVGVPRNIAFSPDSSLLISASADDGTRVWDVRGGLLRIASIPDALGLQFGADSQSIVFATSRGLERRPIIRQPGLFFPVYSARHRMEQTAFSPDGRLLAAMGDKHSSIDLWDTQSGRRLGAFGGLFGGDRELSWLGFSRDGGTLLGVGSTGIISGSIALRDGALSLGWLSTKALPAVCEPGDAGDTSPDGKLLAVRANGNVFFVCDPAHPSKARSITIEGGRIVGLSWSADSKNIAVSNSQGPPLIIDGATLKQTHVLGELSGKAVFSPSGKVLALATAVSCEILDAATFQQLKSFPHQPLESSSDEIVFSGNGAFLAMTQEGRRVDLIDLAHLENVATFEAPPSSRANRLLFSPDGSTLVLHDADNAYFYNIPALRRELAALGLDW